MKKVKITADIILQILQGVFNSDDINSVVVDTSAPTQWQGKTINECLNVDYYTFKHKPISTQQVIAKLEQEKLQANGLLAVDRSYCLLSLSEVQRLYSKDVDMTTVEVNLEYFIQSHKIKLLEWLIEACNIELSGLRVPIDFKMLEGVMESETSKSKGKTAKSTKSTRTKKSQAVVDTQSTLVDVKNAIQPLVETQSTIRQAVIIFDNPKVSDIMQNSSIGEAAIVDISCTMLLYPDAVSYSDYEVSFDFKTTDGEYKTDVKVPLSSFSFVNIMTQKGIPQEKQVSNVGNLNLSRAITFTLVFDGYNNEFINMIAKSALRVELDGDDINKSILMKVKRGDEVFSHFVILKDHQVVVNNDTNNETHSISLVTQFLTLRI